MKVFKVLRVWESSKVLFDQLAKKGGKNNVEFFDELVRERKAGKGSSNVKEVREKGELEKIISRECNRVIGFIKHQEGEYLTPLLKVNQFISDEVSDLNSRKEIAGEGSLEVIKGQLMKHFEKLRAKKNLFGKQVFELEDTSLRDLESLKNLVDQM